MWDWKVSPQQKSISLAFILITVFNKILPHGSFRCCGPNYFSIISQTIEDSLRNHFGPSCQENWNVLFPPLQVFPLKHNQIPSNPRAICSLDARNSCGVQKAFVGFSHQGGVSGSSGAWIQIWNRLGRQGCSKIVFYNM